MSSAALSFKKVPWKRLVHDLPAEIKDDRLTDGAAALAYYLLLALFPALIFLLTLLPYLPIPNLQEAIMDGLRQALPPDAANMLSGTVESVVSQRRGGLLSVGAVATLWAASSGMYALMQQLNVTYDVKEGRSIFEARAIALILTLLFGVLIIGAFALVVLGGDLQKLLAHWIGYNWALLLAFAALRWIIIVLALALGFAIIYYLAPDVEQRFRWVSPGSAIGVCLLIIASIGIRIYTDRFAHYNATYGSLGAAVILMLWLYVAGLVLLLGSEINALIEHYAPGAKQKGEKREPAGA